MGSNQQEHRIAGVHRITKKRKDGTKSKYHYVFRGGPRFWDSTMAFDTTDDRYVSAYEAVMRDLRNDRAPKVDGKSTAFALQRYRDSAEFCELSQRTRDDYEKYLTPFEEEFGEDPLAMFQERAVIGEIRAWRTKWKKSPRQYDYAGGVVTTFLNWCVDIDHSLEVHHHKGQKKLYKANRAQIVWLPEEIDMLLAEASPKEKAVVIAFSEGGLAPQDVGLLRRRHVQTTPKGRRLFFARKKTENPVSLPVTKALGEVIDNLPEGQDLLVTSLTGKPLKALRASQIIRDLKLRHNKKVDEGLLPMRIRDELRAYDMRGTAATALLRAGCSLNEIAVTMGWGLRHAANVIESYAALVPEVSDEVHRKLRKAKKKAAKAARKAEEKAKKEGLS
ncbi:tyrosine-type recombinase/integrase [Roseovarius sp. B08]|uniref:tyrosine-type recombinase/integrase n=1 Tax=Roseovarius sp. B08 TaxID=3449223 RepID=UPI003EDB9978